MVSANSVTGSEVTAATLGLDEVVEFAAQRVSFNVIYPTHEGARFDIDYYLASHIPLVRSVMNFTRVILIEGVSIRGMTAPFVMIALMEFPSAEALETALANPARSKLQSDVANFTDIRPTIMFGRQR